MGEFAVTGEALHVKVDSAVNDIGMSVVNDALNQFDDFRNVLSGSGIIAGAFDAKSVSVLIIIGDRLFSKLLNRYAVTVGPCNHFIVDVSEILYECHFIAEIFKIAAEHIEYDKRTCIADVKIVIYSRTAAVKSHLAFVERDKGLLFTRKIIIKHKCHNSSSVLVLKLCCFV